MRTFCWCRLAYVLRITERREERPREWKLLAVESDEERDEDLLEWGRKTDRTRRKEVNWGWGDGKKESWWQKRIAWMKNMTWKWKAKAKEKTSKGAKGLIAEVMKSATYERNKTRNLVRGSMFGTGVGMKEGQDEEGWSTWEWCTRKAEHKTLL